MSKSITFRQWLWNGLKSWIGTSDKLRSDRQKGLGSFLLISQILWIAFPPTAFRLVFQSLQIVTGVVLHLHGNYLMTQEYEERNYLMTRERKERQEESLKQVRVNIIKYIADRDGVDLEEAEQTFEEMEKWVREAREEETGDALDGLELAMVKGNIQLIEVIAEHEGVSIKEATKKAKKAKRVGGSKPWFRVEMEE